MRLLYWGEALGALTLIARCPPTIELCGFVFGQRGGEGSRRLATYLKSQSLQIPRWYHPDQSQSDVKQALKSTQPDLIAVAYYPELLSQDTCSIAPCIGVHPSDLPKWRGDDPTYWTIREQATHTAICVHLLTPTLNAGPLLTREEVKLRPRETGGSLAKRLEQRAYQVLASTITELHQSSHQLQDLLKKAIPQHGVPSEAPLLAADDLEIDWSLPVNEVDAAVRAAAPRPCAFSGMGRELMIIHRGRPVQKQHPLYIPIGQALIDHDQCLIRCADGYFRLEDVTIGRRRLKGYELAQLLRG